jgi:hemolysin activation/secretion protein
MFRHQDSASPFSIRSCATRRVILCVARFVLVALSLFFGTAVAAQAVPDAEMRRRQAQQLEQAQSLAAPKSDVLSPWQAEKNTLRLPEEQPCFTIAQVDWHGAEPLAWIKAEEAHLLGQCVGAKGLRAWQDYLAGVLISAGYVTSRVLMPEQNLSSGRMVVQVLPGRITAVRDAGPAIGLHQMVFPHGADDLLNQRDLDQALENIRRVAGLQAAEIDLVPGVAPGETEIILRHPEGKRWHGVVTLDDSGADATGKYQLGGALTIDSPLGLYDSLAITLNNNANYGNRSLGTRSTSVSWSVPIGYWALFLGASQSAYKQTVAGFDGDIFYSGRSRAIEAAVNVVPYRYADGKGLLQFKLARKSTKSAIDDTEIDVQRRDVLAYEASFSHRQYVGRGTLDFGLGMRGSIPKFSSETGVMVGVPDWDGRYQIESATAALTLPFKLASERLRYQAGWRIQHATTPLPASEFFSIGNRYSVRGFDGSATLAAEDGWLWRNDLSWSLGASGHELFLGLDAGHVGGPNAELLAGRTLVGAALGLRGQIAAFNFEITAGWPISRPDSLKTREPALTATVALQF